MSTIDHVASSAAKVLAKNDPKLAPIIKAVGPCTLKPNTHYYAALVEAIVNQQLSLKAAATIFGRFKALFGGEMPDPKKILTKDIDELRTVGLSRQKATYIRDLAQHIVDGKVRFDQLDGMTNDEVITTLTDVKGIGEWSAHMFLMFCMARADVLPHGDLGIRIGIRNLYKLDHLPDKQEIIALAEKNHWHPYESIASWYVWKSHDLNG